MWKSGKKNRDIKIGNEGKYMASAFGNDEKLDVENL